MTPEALFVETLDNLHRAIYGSDEYELLRASALVRQLFLDGPKSLVDQANRTHRKKLTFRVVDCPPPSIPGLPLPALWWNNSMNPHVAPPGLSPLRVTRDKFFRMVIASVDEHTFTVRDIVDSLAHHAGGVHLGAAKKPQDQALLRLELWAEPRTVDLRLATLRSIGLVILATLRELKHAVLSLDRFENAPGISAHMAVTVLPMPGGKETYLLDVGVEEERNRISIFLDSHGELCVRVFDGRGRAHVVRAGASACAYRFGQPTYLTCEIGTKEHEILVYVAFGTWDFCKLFASEDGPVWQGKLPHVLGSCVKGKAETRMQMFESCIYDRVLSVLEKERVRAYFEERLARGYDRYVSFGGDEFLHSSQSSSA